MDSVRPIHRALLAALLMVACRQAPDVPVRAAPAVLPDERSVLEAVLRHVDVMPPTERPLFRVGIQATDALWAADDGWRDDAALRPGLVTAFVEANAGDPALDAWLATVGAGTIDSEVFRAHFTADDRWNSEAGFAAVLGGTRGATVIVDLSAVGFSDDGTQALACVGYAWGPWESYTTLYLLERADGSWTVARGLLQSES